MSDPAAMAGEWFSTFEIAAPDQLREPIGGSSEDDVPRANVYVPFKVQFNDLMRQ
jgi:hypothetical protein